jgi:quercetin dioxygenase-like cupin family protein
MKKLHLILLLMSTLFTTSMAQEKEKNYVFSTENLLRYRFPTHINDLIMDRSEAKFSEVFMVVIEPDKGPPLHRHNDTEQIFFMLEGKGTLIIGKEDQKFMKVAPGDVIRIPVDTWHTVKADNKENIKYLAIDCFGTIRNQDEPTWDSHVRVLCKEQGWDYDKVLEKKK